MRIDNVESLYDDQDNLTMCDDMSEQIILHSLRKRLINKQMYTNVGDILISMNPFEPIQGLYDRDQVEAFRGTAKLFYENGDQQPPHVFFIAEDALYWSN